MQSALLVFAFSGNFSVVANDSGFDDKVVVVTANRIQQDINDTLADVEVIERQDIEKIQPQSLTDLLVNISGIDFVQKGGHAQDTSIFVRGANSNQVLVLIDGVRVGSATLGQKSISDISTAQIERVEIVKGPRAALWGSDAIGGVIQVFTRRYLSGESRVGVMIGSNNTSEVDAAIGFGDEQLNSTITYSRKRSDGFDVRIDDELDDDGYQNDSLAIKGSYQLNSSNLFDWVLQGDKGESEFDTRYGGNVANYNNHFWNLRYIHATENWTNQVALKKSRDYTYSVGNAIDRENADAFETRREQYTYLTQATFSEEVSVTGGVEWIIDDIDRTTSDYAETRRESKSAQIGVNYIGNVILADLAIRYDDVQRVNNETSVNLGVGYRLAEEQLISLNYSEGFKAPTFNDLYYPYGGNPELVFELSENIELLYKGKIGVGRLSLSVYDSEVENLIQWVPDSNGVWAPQNVGEAKIQGADLTYSIRHDSYTHKLTASYTSAEDAATGQQLIRRAKNQYGYELGFVGDSFDGFVQLQHVGKRPDNDFQTYSRIMLDSYMRVNLGVGYQFDSNWKFQLKVNDAFDEAPIQVSGYHPIEREYYFTVSYQY